MLLEINNNNIKNNNNQLWQNSNSNIMLISEII